LTGRHLYFALVALSGIALGGCGGDPDSQGIPQGCGPTTCGGCCASGRCEPGTSTLACGSTGGLCQSCQTGSTCSGGTCTAVPTIVATLKYRVPGEIAACFGLIRSDVFSICSITKTFPKSELARLISKYSACYTPVQTGTDVWVFDCTNNCAFYYSSTCSDGTDVYHLQCRSNPPSSSCSNSALQ
jgi:hypothetical protein